MDEAAGVDESAEQAEPVGLAGLAELTVRELLATHEDVLSTLRERGVVRTDDEPAAQYAEWLAQQAFGGELEANRRKSYDLMTTEGSRVQVKCRVIRNEDPGERQLSPFRALDFDEALIILFDASYDVKRATVFNDSQVRRNSKWNARVNGYVMLARDAILDHGRDVTTMLRETGTPRRTAAVLARD